MITWQIDEELMNDDGAFSLDQVGTSHIIFPDTASKELTNQSRNHDQLMELAGLACAQTVARTFPVKSHKRVLVIVGPGNQVCFVHYSDEVAGCVSRF
jgi:hypothetical protein